MLKLSGVAQRSVWSYVVSDDAEQLRAWLQSLGFTEDLFIPGACAPAIHHCQLDWPEGGRVMLSSTGERETPCLPGTSWLHVVTVDPDAVFVRAEAHGYDVVKPMVEQTDYPAREFTLGDPDGNRWTFSSFAG